MPENTPMTSKDRSCYHLMNFPALFSPHSAWRLGVCVQNKPRYVCVCTSFIFIIDLSFCVESHLWAAPSLCDPVRPSGSLSGHGVLVTELADWGEGQSVDVISLWTELPGKKIISITQTLCLWASGFSFVLMCCGKLNSNYSLRHRTLSGVFFQTS